MLQLRGHRGTGLRAHVCPNAQSAFAATSLGRVTGRISRSPRPVVSRVESLGRCRRETARPGRLRRICQLSTMAGGLDASSRTRSSSWGRHPGLATTSCSGTSARRPPRSGSTRWEGRSLVLGYHVPRNELVTGSFQQPLDRGPAPEGYLAAWDGAKDARGRVQYLTWNGTRPSPPNVKAMPVALAFVSSQPGRGLDLAAVVLQSLSRSSTLESNDYQLQLLDLDPANFGALRARTHLWTGPRVQPYLAATTEGDYVAVTGNPENSILVHSAADVLKGQPVTRTLRGIGEPIKTATFVVKGGDWGAAAAIGISSRSERRPCRRCVRRRRVRPDEPSVRPGR